jgi:tetratricopeptide (TPR) repeat protein
MNKYLLAGIIGLSLFATEVHAGRPSVGRVGGGGARPSMPSARPSMPQSRPSPSVSRPSPSISRPSPSVSRPSIGNVNPPNMSRPTPPSVSRPSTPSVNRPSMGLPTTKPTLPGNLPSTNLPTRPSIKPPTAVNPSTRPSLPGGGATTLPGNIGNKLPGTGGGAITLPSNKLPERPSLGNANRPTPLPGVVNKPNTKPNLPDGATTLPGQVGTRPNLPGGATTLPGQVGTRPNLPNRPDLPTNKLPPLQKPDRPVIGGNRPDFNNRPEFNRPGVGNGNGGIGNGIGNNIGNNTNNILNNINNNNFINNNNNIFVGNAPNWYRPGNNWNNPNWGWGNQNHWCDQWHDHCINQHWHGWYNGCWNGYWGYNWYRPVAWVATGWGLSSMTSGWGYGTGYYNPYYVASTTTTVPYNYSQPVVVNNYISDVDPATNQPVVAPETTAQTEAVALFNQALAQFKSGDYATALNSINAAMAKTPDDAVIHEVRALTLFALGKYSDSAATLNSLLSAAPGMDWTSMSALYGNIDDYTKQLRALETHCKANQNDAAAAFVLAYHYLVTSNKDAAVSVLKRVVQLQPKDSTAKRMLDSLAPAETPATPAPAASTVELDLVGTWVAKAGNTTITLSVDDASKFKWSAASANQKPVELTGELANTANELLLQTTDQGAMAGTVETIDAKQWKFHLTGAPANDPGLTFQRQ